MQFNTEKPIDLPKALWGNNPVSIFETKFENEKGEQSFKLVDYASNFGNRPTGLRLRQLILNLLHNNQGSTICIDMHGVKIVASSFADELFGKLVIELGILNFSRFIKIINIEPLCRNIIDVAISQRMVQHYEKDNITFIKDFA